MMKTTAMVTVLGLVAAAAGCGGDDHQAPPATPAQAATAAEPATAAVDATPFDAAAPDAKMSMADMQTAVEKALAANAQDPARTAALFAPDGVQWTPGLDASTGRDAIAASRQAMIEKAPDLKWSDARMWTMGNAMAVQWVANGTDKASGKPIGVAGLTVYTLNDDGLIATAHAYYDTETVMKQTGEYAMKSAAPAVPAMPTSLESHSAKNDATETANATSLATLNADWLKKDDRDYLSMLAPSLISADNSDAFAPHDKKHFAASMAGMRRVMDVKSFKSTNVLSVEDFTIDEAEASVVMKGKGAKHLTMHGVEVDQWKDGKIVKSWSWENSLEIDKQLGAGPFAPAKVTKAATATAAKP